MGLFNLLLLAVSLSMDALGIGFSYGLRGIRTPWPARMVLCITSMFMMAAASALGSMAAAAVPEKFTALIGGGMLFLMGLFLLIQGIFPKKKEAPSRRKKASECRFVLKSLGITVQIIQNPASCDFDGSSHIDIFEAFYLGAALSVDSLGAGIGSAVSGMSPVIAPLLCGTVQLLFLCCGLFFGKKLKRFSGIDTKVFTVFSGLLLLFLALLRIFFG